jgi:hypothetical protein
MENEDVRLVQSLDQIIAKTLQKDPAQRFQTMKELCDAIESASALASTKVPILSIIKTTQTGRCLSRVIPPGTIQETDSFNGGSGNQHGSFVPA